MASTSQPSFGVQPAGNRFTSPHPDCRQSSLGDLHILSDKSLLDILFPLFTAHDLARVSSVSKIFFIFTHQDETWKALCLNEIQIKDEFHFRGNWRLTLTSMLAPQFTPLIQAPEIKISGYFSDQLYLPVMCSQVNIATFAHRDNMPRREAKSFSKEQFVTQFSRPNRPVLITGMTTPFYT